MDSRAALKAGTTLGFNDGWEYTITDELARGGSSIVYNAYYIDNLGARKTVRIKECYPFRCNLRRSSDGNLLIPEAERKQFTQTKQKMRRAYQLGNEFFAADGLTNLTANTYNIYEANHTLYVVSVYAQGQELSYDRYSSVKDSIAAVKSAATAISKIHNKGFLYLDIKPSNILTLEGTTELIQLFDFDTVVPISDAPELGNKISFTKGFAALELQRGDGKRIGTHTDVYGIGALLFYMLFDRVPDAFDCDTGARYDFSRSKLSGGAYRDALTFRLTDFFHHTLADYYLDRFSNMETVVEKLSELQALADLSARYVVSSKIYGPEFFLGREQETAWLTQRLLDAPGGCSFLVGMGGIGKSTLARHCIRQCMSRIDSVLYLDYQGTIEKTICDDYAVQIHGVQKDKSETEEAYFERKLGILRELGDGKNCVLVMDNYTGDNGIGIPKLLQTGWRLLFLTRDKALAQGYDTLEVESVSEETALLLFERHIGHRLSAEERYYATSIIQNASGHTLVIELIAKQIGSPVCTLSLAQAAQIVAEHGFTSLAPEKVGYQRDAVLHQESIQQIISGLFAAETLSETQNALMKALSLFGRTGVSIERLCDMLRLPNRDDIGALYRQGWIAINDTILTMHPVIEEVVTNWGFTDAALDAANRVLQYLNIRLKVEAQKEEYPKHLLRSLRRVHKVQENAPGGFLDRRLQKMMAKDGSGWARESYLHRIGSYAESTATDHDEIREILRLAAAVLKGGKREPQIYSSDIYIELLYYAIQNMPYENEQFLLEKSTEFIAVVPPGNERMLLKVYQILLEILYDHRRFSEAERKIRQMRTAISRNRSPELLGRFYYILAGFYDAKLSGAYDAQTAEETQVVRLLLKSVNKAIHWLSVSNAGDSGILLGECYRLKALVLIRSGAGKKKQVWAILEKVRKQIDKYAQPNSKLVRDYDLTMAWYYTYLEENYPQTCAYLFKAYDITNIISTSELAKIDDQLCPMANLMLEWQQYDQAELYLLRSILTCGDHLEIAAYARRQVELLGHLLEVYFRAGDYSKCRAVMDKINEKVCKIGTLHFEDYVSEEIREFIASESNAESQV